MTNDSDDDALSACAAAEVFGHAEVERLLLADFNRDKLPGAYMFCGPRGIGKASMAYRLAKFLLATPAASEQGGGLFGDALPPIVPESLSISPSHPTAHRIATGSHANVLTVVRTVDEKTKKLRNDIVVDDVRKIGGFLSKSAAEDGYRIVIIDVADEMNANAANAALKWLEEPPERALFILIAHHPGKLLPTIRSRCRAVTFRPPAREAFDRIVSGRLGLLMPEELDHLYYLSGGAPGRAITLSAGDAPAMFTELLELYGSNASPQVLEGFAEQLSGRKKELALADLSALLMAVLAGVIRACEGAGGATPAREHRVFSLLAAKKPLDYWLQLWEKCPSLLADVDRIHLDGKTIVSGVVTALAGEESILHYMNNEA